MSKRILITAGGTGGHIYPALSLAQQLRRQSDSIELLFVGGKLVDNRFFSQQDYPFKSIDCGKLALKNPFTLGSNIIKMGKGILQSRRILQQYSPDLVVGFGSYHTFPILLASHLASIPFILHEANSIPGKVNRLLSKYARTTGIFFPETAARLRGPVLPVKMPLREGYQYGCCSKAEAREALGLDPSLQTVLIFGGSQGAHALNEICSDVLCSLRKNGWQVFHIMGHGENVQYYQKKYNKAGLKCYVKDFEQRMNLAWKAADFAIARAGAGTIAEAIEFEVPALLIPYPYATDRHQEKNADFLCQTMGGGVNLAEKEASAEHLSRILNAEFFCSQKREQKAQAIRQNKSQFQWKELSQLVLEYL